MILQFTLSFPVRVLPPGRREEVERVAAAPVYAEIREAGADDAPLALSYQRNGVPVRVVSFAGRFFEGSPHADGADHLRRLAAEPPRASGDPFGRVPVPGKAVDPAEAGRERSSGRGAAEARLHEAASAFLLVDGILHVSCPEPAYLVEDRFSVAHVSIVAGASGRDPLSCYGAGEAASVESLLGGPIPEASRITVHMADAPTRALADRALLRAGEMARSRLASMLEHGEVGTFLAFRRLREALKAADGRRGTGIDAVRESMRGCLDPEVGLDSYVSDVVSKALDRVDHVDLGDLATLARP
jgi:hypothetical protein